ncbi:oxidoreductase [Pleomorphomonas carboxyditropha]|uniref:Oxidoreductase n=2 Tax=Pleomorphomonas carboxyditropha TaxID=2023338 RepID=A0A2G9X329_9HYPH|nr:SDR family oxidoreductase [Pleomorphomonas carboxyditropha]PIP01380.1 oxidoreductase [Pleomorphomonas carboxyditropha]
MMSIDGKVALITGASSGIGAATALKLAAAGVKVTIAARRADRLEALKTEIVEKGGEALALEMDVTDMASVEHGVKRLIETYGSIDILFNNAGIMPVSEIDQFKTGEWNAMVDINIKGVLNTTAAVLPQMIEQHSGHVFNTSSIAGRKVFGPGFAVYSATKFAVTAFSEGLRMEVGRKHNIRVTCIQPGGVTTELPEQTTDPDKRRQLDAYRSQVRFLDSSDIADAVVFAAQAPAHVNVAELFILPIEQA